MRLRAELRQTSRLTFERCIELGLGLASGLGHMHSHGLIHRDIKPSNIIFVHGQPKLADIGLVAEQSEAKSFVGTEGFIPPEGPGTPEGDIYSLGKVLYEMATGKDRQDFPELPTMLEETSSDQGLLELNSIFLKACQNDPTKRYQNAEELRQDLLILQSGKSVQRAQAVERRLRLLSRASLIGISLTIALVLGLWYSREQTRRESELRKQAQQEFKRAEAGELALRQNLYAADMKLAQEALSQGNFGRARALLKTHEPKAGEKDFRGFEWRFYWGRCRGDELFSFSGHSYIITSVAVSPDAQTFASAGFDGQIKLWEKQSNKLLASWQGDSNKVFTVAFSPDGKWLASGGEDGTVKFWDPQTLQNNFTFRGIPFLPHNPSANIERVLNSSCRIAFAPHGSLIAIGSGSSVRGSSGGQTEIWNYQTREKFCSLPESGGRAVFSFNGRSLATANWLGAIKIWDVETKRLLNTLEKAGAVIAMTFNSDGNRLVTSNWEGEVIVWNVTTGEQLSRLAGHTAKVWSLDLMPGGETLATSSSDQTIGLWDLSRGTRMTTLRGHESEVWSVKFTPDGQSLISGGKDGEIKFWNSKPQPPAQIITNIGAFCFSPDSKAIAIQKGPEEIMVWDITKNQPITAIRGKQPLAACFWPDTDKLVLRNYDQTEHRNYLTIWNPHTQTLSGTVQLSENQGELVGIVGSMLAQDGKRFFGSTADGKILVWDLSSGQLLNAIQAHASFVNILTESPTKRLFASCGTDGVAKLWNVQTLEMLFALTNHTDGVYGLSFSPDGQLLATGSSDGTARIWDTSTGAERAILRGHQAGVQNVVFSPDGQFHPAN